MNFALVDFNPSVQRFALDRTRAYIDQAATLGGKNVLIVIGEYYWDNEVFPAEAIWDIAVGNLKQLAPYADEKGSISSSSSSRSRRRSSRTSTSSRASSAPWTTRA